MVVVELGCMDLIFQLQVPVTPSLSQTISIFNPNPLTGYMKIQHVPYL